MSRANLFTPFTCNFHYSYYSLRIVVVFFTAIIHIPHCTAQMMDSERAGVLLAAVLIYFRLMQNTFVWLLYSMPFRRHRNVMVIRLLTLPSCSTHRFWMRVRNRDWWQRVVFSPEMGCFLPLHRFYLFFILFFMNLIYWTINIQRYNKMLQTWCSRFLEEKKQKTKIK